MFNKYEWGKLTWRTFSFDVLLVIGTMGGIYVLRLDNITWINLESLALILNAIAIITLHGKYSESQSYGVFTALSAVGVALTILPLLPYPDYLIGTIDIIRGHFVDGLRILDGDNPPQPSTFISFVGMALWYSAIVSLIRLGYLRFLNAVLRPLS